MSTQDMPTPAGWYPSPEQDGRQRYWDGVQWTEHYAPGVRQEVKRHEPAGQSLAPWPPNKKLSTGKTIGIVAGAVVGFLIFLGVVGAIAGVDSASTSSPKAAETPSAAAAPEHSDGAFQSHKQTKVPPKHKAVAPKPKAVAPKPAAPAFDLAVQAGQMLKDFEQNEAAADATYKGKVLKVTGHVAKVDTEFWNDDQYIIELDGGGQWAILSVNCNDVSAEQAAKVQPDSTATVIGTFDDGGDLGVEMKGCKVL